jgi:hypothetical protein
MDADRFEALLRSFTNSPSRRGALRVLVGSALAGSLGWLGGEQTRAAKKKKGGGGGSKQKGGKGKGKGKKKRRGEECGSATCGQGSFCCDDARGICCSQGSACCNAAPGTGSCCAPPNQCAKPIGQDSAPLECCPPERQFTGFGVIRCCPGGTRSLGTEISSDDGPCCPEEKYCSNALTGGKCCADLAPICVDRTTERCCTEENTCSDTCCAPPFSQCCNDQCRHDDFGPWTECGDSCCPDGMDCCTSGGLSLCCSQGMVCQAPCGNLDIACCTPESLASGACCNSDCGDNCGG